MPGFTTRRGGLKALVCDERYKADERLPRIVERFAAEVRPIDDQMAQPAFDKSQAARAEFYIRLLFLALVDAHFLDTEAHYTGDGGGKQHRAARPTKPIL